MNYIAFDFKISNPDQSEQLIALLSEQHFNGFEETENVLKAFIAESEFEETSFQFILDLFPGLVYSNTLVENINWNRQWEESFEPVLVENFVAIRAIFHAPVTAVKHEIIITPKMSFGTGHHATTYLMIQQMEAIDFVGKTVLDFGTGTGILAILAEKSGAAKVFAIDNDEWSIDNAKENVLQNGCTKISIEQYGYIPVFEKYDIIIANINLNVITSGLPAIKEVSKNGTLILLSGILKENEVALLEAVSEAGFKYIKTVQKGQWIAVQIINK